MNGSLLPPVSLLPARHCTSHQRQTKHKMCYQLYQELHHPVHTSRYFKRRTFQTEQIKLGLGGRHRSETSAFILSSGSVVDDGIRNEDDCMRKMSVVPFPCVPSHQPRMKNQNPLNTRGHGSGHVNPRWFLSGRQLRMSEHPLADARDEWRSLSLSLSLRVIIKPQHLSSTQGVAQNPLL